VRDAWLPDSARQQVRQIIKRIQMQLHQRHEYGWAYQMVLGGPSFYPPFWHEKVLQAGFKVYLYKRFLIWSKVLAISPSPIPSFSIV
jgi:hypothetical protein